MRFQPSSHSQYGHDDTDYYAQQMLTTYQSGMNVGDAAPGFFDRAVDAASEKGIDTGVQKTGGGGFFSQVFQAGQAGASVAQQAAQKRAAQLPECRKPPGYALWGKKRKTAFNQKCEAAQAAQFSVYETAPPPASRVWLLGGGIAVVGLLVAGYLAMGK